jgi:hypothetical protein
MMAILLYCNDFLIKQQLFQCWKYARWICLLSCSLPVDSFLRSIDNDYRDQYSTLVYPEYVPIR